MTQTLQKIMTTCYLMLIKLKNDKSLKNLSEQAFGTDKRSIDLTESLLNLVSSKFRYRFHYFIKAFEEYGHVLIGTVMPTKQIQR